MISGALGHNGSLGGPLETLTVTRIRRFSTLGPLLAGLWGPRRPPGRPLEPQDARPASPLEPKTLSRQAIWASRRPSRQASGAQDALAAGLWDPRRPRSRPLGSKTPSRQVPWSPRRSPWQATWVLDALLAGPLDRKTPFRRGSLRPRDPFDAPSEVQDPLWAPTTLS